jgi:hypothetical protein
LGKKYSIQRGHTVDVVTQEQERGVEQASVLVELVPAQAQELGPVLK